jgi:hypothetical protein
MAKDVKLEIEDGNPWWLSTAIMTDPVNPGPGDDVDITVRVKNNGTQTGDGVTVIVKWADPILGFTPTSGVSNAGQSAQHSVPPNGGSFVFPMTAPFTVPADWGEKHRCLIAQASSVDDPWTAPAAYDVVGDPQIAQRNLDIAKVGTQGVRAEVQVHNASEKGKWFWLEVVQGEVTELEPVLIENLGLIPDEVFAVDGRFGDFTVDIVDPRIGGNEGEVIDTGGEVIDTGGEVIDTGGEVIDTGGEVIDTGGGFVDLGGDLSVPTQFRLRSAYLERLRAARGPEYSLDSDAAFRKLLKKHRRRPGWNGVPAGATAVYVDAQSTETVRLAARFEGRASVIHITQHVAKRKDPIGGMSFLALDDPDSFAVRPSRR